MINIKNAKQIFDFQSLGVQNLELRAVETAGSAVTQILLEEPPQQKVISVFGAGKHTVWMPWIYHLFCIDGIEKPSWARETHRIFGRASQLTTRYKSFHRTWFLNISENNNACYVYPSSYDLEDLSPAAKIVSTLNAWWMGESNLDYELNDTLYFWKYIIRQLYKSGWDPNKSIKASEKKYYTIDTEYIKNWNNYYCSVMDLVDSTSDSLKELFKQWSNLDASQVLALQKKENIVGENYLSQLKIYPVKQNSANKVLAKQLVKV